MTIEEADELIQLAESGGLVFQAGHLDRFNAQRRDHAQHYSKLRGQSSRA